jgi:hypothetical protein
MTRNSKQPNTKPFAIRLTSDERAELNRRAGEMAVGAYIKGCLFADAAKRKRRGARAPVKDHTALAHVLASLGQSRLAENMTALANAAESGTLVLNDDTPRVLAEACEDIVVMRLLLMKAFPFADSQIFN